MEIGPIFRAMAQNKTKVVLLVLEVAFTVTIVLNCFNMIIDQQQRLSLPTGIDEDNLIAIQAQPFGLDYQDEHFLKQLVDRDLASLRALPGVIDATPISNYPLQGGGSSYQAKPLEAPESDRVRSPVYMVDHHFLETLDLEIVEGRGFTAEDLPVDSGPQIMNMIVTKDLADALYPDGNAVGQTVDTGSAEYPDVIVGVVDHMFTPYGGGPMETRITFYPSRAARASRMRYIVRAEPSAYNEVFAAVDTVLLANQGERVFDVRTMVDIKGNGYTQNVFVVRVLTTIIVLLLFVTSLGIFGMTSFSVAQRTKQVGTRRALGAQRADVVRYFLVENSLITMFGLALGLIGAYSLNIVLLKNLDGTILPAGLALSGCVVLWVVGLLAAAYPATRASHLSPALATRTV